jgi:hypothetical protein
MKLYNLLVKEPYSLEWSVYATGDDNTINKQFLKFTVSHPHHSYKFQLIGEKNDIV